MKRFLAITILALIGSLAHAQVRIACGEIKPYTDSAGNVWSADTSSVGSAFSTTHAIAGTTDPTLYQNERWSANDAPALTYTLPAPSGSYTLNLYFSEDYFSAAKQRLFNVKVNGIAVLTNFDILATAGGQFTANKQTFQVTSTGSVIIEFDHGSANNPKCDAIELLQAAPTPLIFPLAGLGTATFAMFSPPACGPNDGICSIQIQIIMPPNSTCATDSTGTTTCTGQVGTLNLLKSITLPTPQVQTTPIVTVTNP